MAKKATKKVELKSGDLITIEVVRSHDDFKEGLVKDVHYCDAVKYMLENGFWKLK